MTDKALKEDWLVDVDSLSPEHVLWAVKQHPDRVIYFTKSPKDRPVSSIINAEIADYWKRVEWVHVPTGVPMCAFLMGYLSKPSCRNHIREWVERQPEWKSLVSLLERFQIDSKEKKANLKILTNRPDAFKAFWGLAGFFNRDDAMYTCVSMTEFKQGQMEKNEEESESDATE